MTPLDFSKFKTHRKCPTLRKVARDRLEMLSEAQQSAQVLAPHEEVR